MNTELRQFLSRLAGAVGLALSVVTLVAFAAVPLGRDPTFAQSQHPAAPSKHMT